MATEKQQAAIRKRGHTIFITHTIGSAELEAWVKKVEATAGVPMDWGYCAGYAGINYLGPEKGEVREKVRAAVAQHMPEHDRLYRAACRKFDHCKDEPDERIRPPRLLTLADEEAEAKEKEKRAQEFETYSDKMLRLTEYVVYGDNEHVMLWWQIHSREALQSRSELMPNPEACPGTIERRMSWEQKPQGMWATIDKKTKTTVSITWYRINGHLIAFLDGTSQIVSWPAIEKWIKKAMPNSKGDTNSSNLHHMLHYCRGEH